MAPYIPQQQNNTGLYVPTTTIFDTINSLSVNTDLKQVLVVLYQTINTFATTLNQKQTGIYNFNEIVNGKGWVDPNPNAGVNNQPRSCFTKAFIKSLPPGVLAFNHEINGTQPLTAAYTFTDLYGVANDTVGKNYYPFCGSGAGLDIAIRATATQIIITNNTGITFDIVNIVAEYLKY